MKWQWDSPPRLDEPQHLAAEVTAEGIRAALAERKPLCRQCFNIYVPHERPNGAMFECRSILMLPDSEPDPMLCDGCFSSIVGSFNRHATNVGTSNCGPTNLVLQSFG